MTRYGFTGTQQGMTQFQKDRLALLFQNGDLSGEFHHGDCIGADAEAHDIARTFGVRVIIHPPVVRLKRAFRQGDFFWPEKPYLDRNHDIVDETDLLVAAPKTLQEELRSGTWATVRYARKQGKRVIILEP